jgi:hypothetical protein
MNIAKLTAALTIAGLFAASPVLAQTSQMKQPQNPTYPSDGGAAGGFASSTDKDAASKQKAQNLTPSSAQDAAQAGKQK